MFKKPIELYTIRPMRCVFDGFGQKIIGNYDLMGSHITPKSLMFLLTAPVDFPEDLGATTHLDLSNSVTDLRQTTIQVVNHIINRVMVEQDTHFTYQDTIYLTTMLRKIGIENASAFLTQVQTLKQEQTLMSNQIKLYKSLSQQSILTTIMGNREGKLSEHQEQTTPKEPSQPQYTLHESIFKRLGTKEIYNTLVSFKRNQLLGGDTFSNQQMRLSEHLHVSQQLSLQEYKQKILPQSKMEFHQILNQYELGNQENLPSSEEVVIQRAVEAMLLSTITQVMSQTINQTTNLRATWLTMNENIAQMGAYSLKRFVEYHSQREIQRHEGAQYSPIYQNLAKEEIINLKSLQQTLKVYHSIREEKPTIVHQTSDLNQVILNHPTGSVDERLGETEHHEHEAVLRERAGIEVKKITQNILTQGVNKIQKKPHKAQELEKKNPVKSKKIKQEERLLLESRHYLKQLETIQTMEEQVHTVERSEQIIQPQEVIKLLSNIQSTFVELFQSQETALYQTKGHHEHQVNATHMHHAKQAVTELDVEALVEEPIVQMIVEKMEQREQKISEADKSVVQHLSISDSESTHSYHHTKAHTEMEFHHNTKFEQEVQTEPIRLQGDITTLPPHILLETLHAINNENVQQYNQWKDQAEERKHTIFADHTTVKTTHISQQKTEDEEGILIENTSGMTRDGGNQILSQLNIINQRNQERLEKLKETIHQNTIEFLPSKEISARTMEAARLALQHPQELIESMKESQTTQRNAEMTPETQMILAQTDAETRKIYEAVMEYQANPTVALEKGLIQRGNLGAFNVAMAEDKVQINLQHPSDVSALQDDGFSIPNEYVQTLNQTVQYTKLRPETQKAQSYEKMPFVFKRQDHSTMEELLEVLEERKIESVQQKTTTETHHEQTNQQVHRYTSKQSVVSETTEDITAIVNRTVAKQMGIITDKVYQQMERKLQNERSRRGR